MCHHGWLADQRRAAQLAGEFGSPGECVPGHSSQQKADWAGARAAGGGRAGQAGSQEQSGSRQGGNRSQSEPKAAREKPGCEQGLVTRWRVWLADWGQEATSQGPGWASGD